MDREKLAGILAAILCSLIATGVSIAGNYIAEEFLNWEHTRPTRMQTATIQQQQLGGGRRIEKIEILA